MGKFNPNYEVKYKILPSRIILHRWMPDQTFIDESNQKIQYYPKLEKSILDEGFINPILVLAGGPKWYIDFVKDLYLIDGPFQDRPEREIALTRSDENQIITGQLGGARLLIAQQHNLDIPCIVQDYNDSFPDIKEISNLAEFKSYFSEHQLNDLKFNDDGIEYEPGENKFNFLNRY